MIKEQSIDEVRNADIVRVVGNFLELKKTGSKYFALSPFSNDKSASFCVTPSLNIFKCFSTGKGGDGIKFLQLYKNLNFVDAVKMAADICGITLLEEEVTEDVKRKIEYKQQLFEITSWTAAKYAAELFNLPADHWGKKMIADREINEDTIVNFGIGFAPATHQFISNPVIESGKLELALTVGVTNTKDGRNWDFFKDRLIFPIQDDKGNVIGFGGRRQDGIDGPKYINTRETEIYHKSKVLYGLYQAKAEISKSKTTILCEGYTDVTALHQNGCNIGIANCGTASLSDAQCQLLSRFANHVIICRDNDGLDDKGNEQKGTLAAMKDIDVLLSHGFKVSIIVLPEGEDPDSFSRKNKDINQYIFDNLQDAVIWKTTKLKNKSANDPNAMSEAVNDVCMMLHVMKNDIVRNSYMETCRKLLKQPAKAMKDILDSFVKKAEIKASQTGEVAKGDAGTMGLPEGADFSMYFDKGYVEHGHTIYFKGREKFFMGTNFRIMPLFHIYGKSDNKRLFEMINVRGQKKIIDIDSVDLTNKTKFEAVLLSEGDFKLMPETTDTHFKWLRNDLLSSFVMAYELKTLGWQQEKFFAFANCVYHQGTLKEANKYGIIQLETGAKQDNEYFEDVKHFYSPSESVMYKNSRDGDDPYENDRFFVYKQSPVKMEEWMQQFTKVYGKKAVTGIAFAIATMFRDIYLRRYQFFPHLFCTGEKGSGKSKFGESIAALFTYKQEAFDLNSGTPVAFYRRLSRITNIPTMLEEYHDGVDDKIFQTLKGAFDGRGREMGKATGDNRTTTTKVNSSCIILSQYLSARDDNSLTSRSIVEHFIKPMESYTTEQIETYAKLKSWEEDGLSSLLCDIMKHREFVEEHIHTKFAELSKRMKADLKGKDYQERMMTNYLALLTPVLLLKPHFHFPFTEKEIWNQFKDAIIDSSDLIIESEGLAEFWRTLEFLLDTHRIATDNQFMIERAIKVKLQSRKGEADTTWNNSTNDKLLFLRLNAVHQLYHKEVSTREGVEVIGENTLKNYFRSKRYFVGSVKSFRFANVSTSAYVFNYSMMEAQGILNLERGVEKQTLFDDKDDKDDLPY